MSTSGAVAVRSCGEKGGRCAACCFTHRTHVTKPQLTHCVHEAAHGCAIYDRRFAACKKFICAWLAGEFGESDRPDKIGVVPHYSTVGSLRTLILAELHAGAMDSDWVQKQVKAALARGEAVYMLRIDGKEDSELPEGVDMLAAMSFVSELGRACQIPQEEFAF